MLFQETALLTRVQRQIEARREERMKIDEKEDEERRRSHLSKRTGPNGIQKRDGREQQGAQPRIEGRRKIAR